jgi:hypothetical protein
MIVRGVTDADKIDGVADGGRVGESRFRIRADAA